MTISDNPTRNALEDIRSWQEAKRSMEQAAANTAAQYGHDPVLIRHQIARLSFGSAAHGWRSDHQRKVLWRALEIARRHRKEIP
jgi:hypothetical protein